MQFLICSFDHFTDFVLSLSSELGAGYIAVGGSFRALVFTDLCPWWGWGGDGEHQLDTWAGLSWEVSEPGGLLALFLLLVCIPHPHLEDISAAPDLSLTIWIKSHFILKKLFQIKSALCSPPVVVTEAGVEDGSPFPSALPPFWDVAADLQFCCLQNAWPDCCSRVGAGEERGLTETSQVQTGDSGSQQKPRTSWVTELGHCTEIRT